ncbi:MAG: BamA/TamA family outer membrane protein [Gemmatimonadetes bacterium]|nr:BamA/TamA family outer membrane protein [Gemmatimonadota bacterium]
MRWTLWAVLVTQVATPALAQQSQTGLGWSALPALNYDSDQGFGYGVTGGLYQYGDGSQPPYLWAFEPIVFFTTRGRRSVTVFYDAPRQFGEAVRLTVRAYVDRDCCQPYFGLGNASAYDAALTTRPSLPDYYTYRRNRATAVVDLQWRVLPQVRLLTGVAVNRNTTAARDPSTQFAVDLGNGTIPSGEDASTSLGPKVGLVYDTRDLERDPRRGMWLEGIAWQGVVLPGGDDFTRWTGTLRGYLSLDPSLTVAARVFGEHIEGAMPVAMLSDLGSSFQDFGGLGGAESVRGVLWQRFLGRTRALSNLEVRWRGPGFRFLGAPWQLGAVGFVDAGRVWDDRGAGDGAAGLHWGKGGGLRVAWGQSFIIAADFGHGREAGLQTYLKLGHMF